MEGVIKLVEEYDMKLNMMGLCFDTTSSNTGMTKGSLVRITEDVGHYLLLLACRHHVTELRMVHFWKSITNDTTSGPNNILFKKLKDTFENPSFKPNIDNLASFDWKAIRGTVIESAALDSLNYCKVYLQRKDIIRDDRKELAELVVAYLSGQNSALRKTGAIHHARFIMKAIYYLKLARLAPQLEFVRDKPKLCQEIKAVAEFVSCFYAIWYLQADNTIKAPYLDMNALQQMHKYKEVCDNMAAVDKVLTNMFKHVWYLDSTIIPLALLDEAVPDEEKTNIAKAIMAIKMPHKDRFDYKSHDKPV